LASIAAKNERLLNLKDKNGWQPIHEAARAGHRDVVEFLVKKASTLMPVSMMERVTRHSIFRSTRWEVITLFPSIS
jgi:ankyrin repeat protein